MRMRGLRLPLTGYALPALSPDKKQGERQQQNALESIVQCRFARDVHSGDHVASSIRCQYSKIQLLVIPSGPEFRVAATPDEAAELCCSRAGDI